MSAARTALAAAAALIALAAPAMRSAPPPDPDDGDEFVVSSTPLGYTDDFRGALKRAKREGKAVMAAFTGSDWCGWCRRFEFEVLLDDRFLDAVTNRAVAVFVDSPVDRRRLTPAARRQNPALAERYGVDDRPLIVVTDAAGAELGRERYGEADAAEYARRVLALIDGAGR